MKSGRAALLILLALGLLLEPFVAEAQEVGKVHRVALVFPVAPVSGMAGPEPVSPTARAFVRALRAFGYVEGQNLILERRSAEGNVDRNADILTELIRLKVDVIVVGGTPLALRAKELTTTVPIVMVIGADPVALKVVRSLARPGENITGFTVMGTELGTKRLALLKEMLPGASRIAFLGMKRDWELAKGVWGGATQALGLTMVLAEHTPNDYTSAFSQIGRDRPDALFVTDHNSALTHARLIVDFATRSRLPSSHAFGEAVELGGLMSYGANTADLFRRAAGYVDRILKGAKPGDLPIEQPTKFELVINLKTATALGLTIPPSLLLRADQVIE
jgi:putative ABC transport system substrate-binding protein